VEESKTISIKDEAGARFAASSSFINGLQFHWEPPSASKHSSIYHASTTVQTRMVEIDHPSSFSRIELLQTDNEIRTEQEIQDRKDYYSLRNKDGCKTKNRLFKGENFNFKPCWFHQAVAPACIATKQTDSIFAILRSLNNRYKYETDYNQIISLENAIKLKKGELRHIRNNYNSSHFLHYRVYFFDLDYARIVPVEEILDFLKEIELFPYLRSVVKTSLTGYHLYMKSEMIASRKHVANWPIALTDSELLQATDPKYLEELAKRCPNRNGLEWRKVRLRGLPAPSRLSSIPIPIPEEAELIDGLYYGDDNCYKDFLKAYKEIAHVLGSDESVLNSVGLAQLPGYSNPKSGFTAHEVYTNTESPVLTLKIAKNQISENIKDWCHKNNKKSFYVPSSSNRVERTLVVSNKEVLKKFEGVKIKFDPSSSAFVLPIIPIKKVEESKVKKESKESKEQKNIESITKTKGKKKISCFLPSSFEEYCSIHELNDSLIWDYDINGHSDAMLKLLSRYAFTYIDLENTEQQEMYFDTIIKPYFNVRDSAACNRTNRIGGLRILFRRFVSLCKNTATSLTPIRNDIARSRNLVPNQKYYTASADLQKDWNQQLIDTLGADHRLVTNKVEIKLRSLLCDYVIAGTVISEENNRLHFQFQIPAKVLADHINGYKKKLKVYEELGFYSSCEDYKRPIKRNGRIAESGECKKSFLNIKAKEIVLEQELSIASKIMENNIKEETKVISEDIKKFPTQEEIKKYTDDEKKTFLYDILVHNINLDKFTMASTLLGYIETRDKEKEDVFKYGEKLFVDTVIDRYLNNQLPVKTHYIQCENMLNALKHVIGNDPPPVIVDTKLPSMEEIETYDDAAKKTFIYNKLMYWLPEELIEFKSLKLLQTGAYDGVSRDDYEKILIDSLFEKYLYAELPLLKTPRESLNVKYIVKEEAFDPLKVVFIPADKNLSTDEQCTFYSKQIDAHRRRCKEEINKTRNHDPKLREELDQNKKELYDIIQELNELITLKDKLYWEFRNRAEDRYDWGKWVNPGCLNRDNMTKIYIENLQKEDPLLYEFYLEPVRLYAVEHTFTPKVEKHALRIVYLKNTVPIPLDYDEDFSYLKKCKSQRKYVISLLALL